MRTRVALVTAAVTALVLAHPSVTQASVEESVRACAQPNGRVYTSAISSGVIYIGGSFTQVVDAGGSQPRTGLAAIDMSTCRVLSWKANTNADVYALTATGSTVYAGGAFTSIGGQSRLRLAALDAADATVLPFSHGIEKQVSALTTSGGKLYAGGKFSKVDGLSRGKLAAFDLGSGGLSGTWKPKAVGAVSALTPSSDGSRIYVGGSFTSLDGSSGHAYVGAVDAVSGDLVTGFNATPGFPILALAADSRGVYAGGGGHGGHLVIWDANGSLQRPIYQTDGGVQAVAVDGDSLYAGGHFTNYCVGNTGSGSPFICDDPLSRRKLFEVSLSSGDLTGWAPRVNSSRGVFTESVAAGTGDLWIGGDFTTVNEVAQAHLGVFSGI